MMIHIENSEKKDQMVKEYLNKPFEVGDRVKVPYSLLNTYVPKEKENALVNCKILEVNGEKIVVTETEYGYKNSISVSASEIQHNLFDVGINPIPQIDGIDYYKKSLDSLVYELNLSGDRNREYEVKDTLVSELNWNPIVFKNGKAVTYQRGFVWSEAQKQNLIESIYLGLDCGRILIRQRSFKELNKLAELGVKYLAFRDIVDGKQRLNALRGFVACEFPDLNGNYFNDFSDRAKHEFLDRQVFMWASLPEESTDKTVLTQFLRLNFEGVPQSIEHLNYVRDLLK